MKKILFLITLIITVTNTHAQTCTSSGSCNMWRAYWSEDGDLGGYKPNKQEIAVFESIKNLTTSKQSGLKSDIKMVRQDMTDGTQRYFVLFDILNPDGTVRKHREMDLATYKSQYN